MKTIKIISLILIAILLAYAYYWRITYHWISLFDAIAGAIGVVIFWFILLLAFD